MRKKMEVVMKGFMAGSLLVAASVLVSNAVIAKCASISTRERFLEAENVILVSIVDAHDGAVPWPYGLRRGETLPGRLLTLRVIRVWKGSFRPEAVVHGWTLSPDIEDAYPQTSVGTQIILFSSEGFPHEIMSCNAADPNRIKEVSEELDTIVRKKQGGRSTSPSGTSRGS
jgi:hypothetical protein